MRFCEKCPPPKHPTNHFEWLPSLAWAVWLQVSKWGVCATGWGASTIRMAMTWEPRPTGVPRARWADVVDSSQEQEEIA